MIYTVLSKIKHIGSSEHLYIVHGYNQADLTNLVPESVSEIMTEDDLIQLYKSDKLMCSNFSVDTSMKLNFNNTIPEKVSAESHVTPPRISTDDVWNFLYRLQASESLLIVSKDEFSSGGFSDEKKTYMVNPKTMVYSTTHANCSVHLLIDGNIYNPETDEVRSSKRWYTKKIIKDNKLTNRYLTLATTETGLEILRNDSKVDIKVFPMSAILNIPRMDITESATDLFYCVVDLYSLPLIETNVLFTSNTNLIYNTVQLLNSITIVNKVCKSFLQELSSRDSSALNLYESDDFYKERAIYDDEDTKSRGVKFSLSGQSNIPSVNACIKALKSDKVKSVGDIMSLSSEELTELKSTFYRLNILQRTALQMLFHLCEEYTKTRNPVICYQATDDLCKFYSTQKELLKARLTYIRSMFMENIHPSLFEQKKLFTSEFDSTTVFIEFGEF